MPTAATLERILRAAGFDCTLELTPRVREVHPGDRGRELLDVLELAALFPARRVEALRYPRFGPL